MEKTICITVEVKTAHPIEAVKEHLALYCERMGDVKVKEIKIKSEVDKDGI